MRHLRLKYLILLSTTTCGTMSGAALAAEPVSGESDVIVVTGSRIKQAEVNSVSPLVISTSADIKMGGVTRIEDFMNSLPQVEAAENGMLSNGATGTATLDLRGMGSSRTLVLVNGRRLQPGSVLDTSADVNQIPTALVKQVDVVTGGASSVYGADAVAGVVNFALDKKFKGIQIDVDRGSYWHKNNNSFIGNLINTAGYDLPRGTEWDGGQLSVDLTMGTDFAEGRGHIVAYGTYRKISELRQGSRDYSGCALNAGGTKCGGSGTAANPNFYVYPIVNGAVDYDAEQYLMLDSNNKFVDSSNNLYNYAPVNFFQRPDKRYTLGTMMDFEVSDAFKPFVEVMWARSKSVAQIAESGTFFNDEYSISCNSPLLTSAQSSQLCGTLLGLDPSKDSFATYIGKRNVEGGPRQSNLTNESLRIVAGAKGNLNAAWEYEFSWQYGQSKLDQLYLNDLDGSKIIDALNVTTDASGKVVCDSPSNSSCVPYNVFTYNGVTSDAAGTLATPGVLTGKTKESIAQAFVTGDTGFHLPTADNSVKVVFGGEYRTENYNLVADEVFEQGLLLGQGGPTPSTAGKFHLWELFTEINIPLVEEKKFIEKLVFEGGFRHSDYSLSGGADTYKMGLNWTVVRALQFRGAFNRAVRSPTPSNYFSPTNLGLWEGADPCAGAAANGVITSSGLTAEQCARTGVTAAQFGNISESPAGQYNGLSGGNRNLSPETADTITAGIILQPLRNLVFSVDYYDIKLKEAIGTIGSELTINTCAKTGEAQFCDLIHRSSAGSLWLGENGYVVDTAQNIGQKHFRGLDVASSLRFNIPGGVLTTKLNGSYLLKKETTAVPGITDSIVECKGKVSAQCFPSPKWRHKFTVDYDLGKFGINGRWRYVGKVTGPATTGLNAGAGSQSYFDLTLRYDVNEHFGLSIGGNNIFDKDPPLFGNAVATSNGNTFPGIYDAAGRYVFISGKMKI
jgi:outer membrane receptor protein involved in Fe transport